MSTPHQTARSLNKQQILEEDEYTEALSEIIARDFFPSLVHLDATNSYLDALQSKDTHLINASVRRLQDLSTPQIAASRRARHLEQTPGRTPYGNGPSDTPARTPRTETGPSKRPRYDTSLSLDNFQSRYTSEDNASFTEILDEENRKRKEKWSWAWEAQRRARDVKAIEMEKRSCLLIEDSTTQPPGVRERIKIEAPKVKLITSSSEVNEPSEENHEGERGLQCENADDETATTSNSQMVTPPAVLDTAEGAVLDVLAPKRDLRSATVDGWSFKTRNSLMFTPDADRSPFNGPTSLATTRPEGPPRIIKHANTRLPEQSNEDEDISSLAPSSPTQSKIGAAIAGTPYVSRSERTDFQLLPALPSPTPSQLGPAAVNKLMTWGTISSTPRIISSDPETEHESIPPPATPFHLPGPSPRERVAHKLSSTASRSLRAKASLFSGTPGPPKFPFHKGRHTGKEAATPATPRPHPSLLTPAARRLLDRTAGLGTSASRRAEAMRQESNWEGMKSRDIGNVRWTPSPGRAKSTM